MRRCLVAIGLAALLNLSAAAETPKPDQQAKIEMLVKDLFLANNHYCMGWKIQAGKLAQIGPEAIPSLMNQIKVSNWESFTRTDRGAETIRLMGVKALPAIAEILERDPYSPKSANRYGHSMLHNAMAMFGRDALPFAERLMKSEVTSVRLHAIHIYAEIGNLAPEALQGVAEAMKSKDAVVRRETLVAMKKFGSEGVPLVLAEIKPDEIDLLDDVIAILRFSLNKESLPPEALPYAKAYLNRSPPSIPYIADILERIGPPAHEMLPELLNALATNGKSDSQEDLMNAIASVNANDGGLESAIAEGLAHSDPTVRSWCLEYLKTHAAKTETLREAVRKVEAQQGDRPTDETLKAMELLKEPAEKP